MRKQLKLQFFTFLLAFGWLSLAGQALSFAPQDRPLIHAKGKAEIEEVEGKEETERVSVRAQLDGTPERGLALMAAFEVKERKSKTIKDVELIFLATTPECQYGDKEMVELSVDAVKLSLGDAVLVKPVPKTPLGCVQTLRQRIPYKTFVKILDAQQVTGQVGKTAFTLDTDDLEALRDMRRTLKK